MALLPLFAAVAGSNQLWQLDDDSVFDDAGTPFVPTLDTHPVDFGPAGGYGRLREALQWVAPSASARVELIPIADDVVDETQRHLADVFVQSGREQRIEAPFSLDGTRFSVRLRVPVFTGGVAFGEADLLYVMRRSKTGPGSR